MRDPILDGGCVSYVNNGCIECDTCARKLEIKPGTTIIHGELCIPHIVAGKCNYHSHADTAEDYIEQRRQEIIELRKDLNL